MTRERKGGRAAERRPQQPSRRVGKSVEQATHTESRSFRKVLFGVIASLGILGAIGSYYVPKVLQATEDRFDPRPPIKVDQVSWTTDTPNFLFPPSVPPASVSMDLFQKKANNSKLLNEWSQSNGGVALAEQQVDVVIRGRDDRPVVINSIEVQVIDRQPANGLWFNIWQGCGSVSDVRLIAADLSTDEVVEEWTVEGETPVDPPVLRVTDTDVEVIRVKVSAPAGPAEVVSWRIDLGYSTSQQSGHIEVVPSLGEFRLATYAAAETAEPYVYSSSTGELKPSPNSFRGASKGSDDIC